MSQAVPGASAFGALSAEAYLSLGAMEGLYDTPFVEALPKPIATAAPAWPGYLAASLATAAAYGIHYLPLAPFQLGSGADIRRPISAAIIAIILGVFARNLFPIGGTAATGCKRIVRKVLPATIVFTGAGLNLLTITTVGPRALIVTVLCIAVATAAAYYFGRLWKLGERAALLIGAGTAICGNSAIVAVAPLIDAEDEDLVLSIATVNLFGLVAMLCLPLAGGLLGMSNAAFGIWAGTTVHSVPQAVAAGFAYSHDAGTLATLVKLVRVALLAPLVFVLALHYARRRSDRAGHPHTFAVRYSRLVPWFVWGFLILALLNTLGLIPLLTFQLAPALSSSGVPWTLSLSKTLSETGTILLTLAMAAIGLELDVHLLMRIGGRAVATGLAASAVLAIWSFVLIRVSSS